MVAIELVKNGAPISPMPISRVRWCRPPARHGLIILSCGVYGNVIRFLAPLTISDALLGEGLDRLEAALAKYARADRRHRLTRAEPAIRIAGRVRPCAFFVIKNAHG